MDATDEDPAHLHEHKVTLSPFSLVYHVGPFSSLTEPTTDQVVWVSTVTQAYVQKYMLLLQQPPPTSIPGLTQVSLQMTLSQRRNARTLALEFVATLYFTFESSILSVAQLDHWFQTTWEQQQYDKDSSYPTYVLQELPQLMDHHQWKQNPFHAISQVDAEFASSTTTTAEETSQSDSPKSRPHTLASIGILALVVLLTIVAVPACRRYFQKQKANNHQMAQWVTQEKDEEETQTETPSQNESSSDGILCLIDKTEQNIVTRSLDTFAKSSLSSSSPYPDHASPPVLFQLQDEHEN